MHLFKIISDNNMCEGRVFDRFSGSSIVSLISLLSNRSVTSRDINPFSNVFVNLIRGNYSFFNDILPKTEKYIWDSLNLSPPKAITPRKCSISHVMAILKCLYLHENNPNSLILANYNNYYSQFKELNDSLYPFQYLFQIEHMVGEESNQYTNEMGLCFFDPPFYGKNNFEKKFNNLNSKILGLDVNTNNRNEDKTRYKKKLEFWLLDSWRVLKSKGIIMVPVYSFNDFMSDCIEDCIQGTIESEIDVIYDIDELFRCYVKK